MEKSWLEKFYTECGREVALAYNVLNYTNNWGVTLGAAVLATGFMSAVKVEQGGITILYPTTTHWFFVILSWIIMVRFFLRSALALVNMYRWNDLIFASSKVLSLSEEDPRRSLFERNLEKKIDAYFYKWKSPKKKSFIIWHNLKLMYLWFFLIVLGLFAWGAICLQRDLFYFLGIAAFMGSTLIETIWFAKWHGMKYEALTLEPEPDMLKVWQSESVISTANDDRSLVFGFCSDGPYKHATSMLTSQSVKWCPWSYHASSLDASVAKDLALGVRLSGRRVFFVSWVSKFNGMVPVIRCGRIDHFVYANQVLRVTVHLEECTDNEKPKQIKVKDPSILCQYV
jgi:hypothetical protein